MKYVLKEELNANGNSIFAKRTDGHEIFYIVKDENGQIAYKPKDWVYRNAKNIINLTVSADNKLVVKGKTKKTKVERPKQEMVKRGVSVTAFKDAQFKILSQCVGRDERFLFRSPAEIKLWKEVLAENKSFGYGDFDEYDAAEASRRGKVGVYTTFPVQQGNVVFTSRSYARDFIESGNMCTKELKLTDIAWLNGDVGRVAKVK